MHATFGLWPSLQVDHFHDRIASDAFPMAAFPVVVVPSVTKLTLQIESNLYIDVGNPLTLA